MTTELYVPLSAGDKRVLVDHSRDTAVFSLLPGAESNLLKSAG